MGCRFRLLRHMVDVVGYNHVSVIQILLSGHLEDATIYYS